MSGTFSVHTMELPAPCPAHSHDFLEAACIRRGWTLHTVNGVTRRLEEGDVVLVDFGEVHSFDGGSADLLVTNCLFQPVLLDPSLASCRTFPALLDSCLPGLGGKGGPCLKPGPLGADQSRNVHGSPVSFPRGRTDRC